MGKSRDFLIEREHPLIKCTEEQQLQVNKVKLHKSNGNGEFKVIDSLDEKTL